MDTDHTCTSIEHQRNEAFPSRDIVPEPQNGYTNANINIGGNARVRLGNQYHGIASHLLPFLPYIEKSSPDKLLSAWHWPDSLSEPINISILKTWLSTCDALHGNH